MKPNVDIEACREAHRRLLEDVGTLSDDACRVPSRLPGWTRAHVVTHLARNADSHVFVLEGLKLRERRRQYASPEAREADIAAGGTRNADELRSDVHHACLELEAAWEALPVELWRDQVALTAGARPVEELVFRRLREVEVHHVDLDLGYSPGDWDEAYIEKELLHRLPGLTERADHRQLVSWLLGRGPAPELGPW